MLPGFGCFGNYGSYGWIGILTSLVIIIVVMVGIIWLVMWFGRKGIPGTQGYSMTPHTNPREILQIRYARGEITREEYFEILDELN